MHSHCTVYVRALKSRCWFRDTEIESTDIGTVEGPFENSKILSVEVILNTSGFVRWGVIVLKNSDAVSVRRLIWERQEQQKFVSWIFLEDEIE